MSSELKDTEVDDGMASMRLAIVVYDVVRLCLHGSDAVCTHHTDFEVHAFISSRQLFHLGLLDKNFEEAH